MWARAGGRGGPRVMLFTLLGDDAQPERSCQAPLMNVLFSVYERCKLLSVDRREMDRCLLADCYRRLQAVVGWTVEPLLDATLFAQECVPASILYVSRPLLASYGDSAASLAQIYVVAAPL